MNMINRLLKPTIGLGIKSFSHDAGNYIEVVCYFDDDDEGQVQEMLRLERELPGEWDETAKAELTLELQGLQARYANAQ